jgi:DNA (cytosine-5)-methyltransferase 1
MRTHLDLCSGVGGFSLAAQWAGFTTIGIVEIDPWCRRVLKKNFPNSPQHDDLKTLTGAVVRAWIDRTNGADDSHSQGFDGSWKSFGDEAEYPKPCSTSQSRLDLLTAGYPCQPFSLAGKRLGAEDDRHLWPFIAALVADLKPRRCLFENVFGHVSMGLDDVLADLEALGYACGAVVVPAAAVGAPHRRDRVWILAERSDVADAECRVDEQPSGIRDSGRGWFTDSGQASGGNLSANRAGSILADSERIGRRELLRTDAVPESLSQTVGGEGAPWFGSGGADVADSDEQRSNGAGSRGAGRHELADSCRNDADAEGGRVRRGRASGDERQPAFRGEGDHGGEALSSLGDETSRLSGLLARSGWRVGPDVLNPWAGDWESGCPRTTEQETDRVHKLKALGNSIVPQVAFAILDAWGPIREDTPMIEPAPSPALSPTNPRATVRRMFAATKRFPTVAAVLTEARAQYPSALAVYAHPLTIAAHALAGVTPDDHVPVGLIEIEATN